MNTKVLSILVIVIGFIFYSAYPVSKFYYLPDFAIYLFVSLGCCLVILGKFMKSKNYSKKLLLDLFFIFIIFSLFPIVTNNITIWFWLITIIIILFQWYYEKKCEKKNDDNTDKVN